MRLLTLAVLLFAAACQTAPPEMTDAERAEIEAAVTESLQVWVDGASALDAAQATSVMDPQVDFVDFYNLSQGRAELLEWTTSLLSNYQSWEGALDQVTVEVMSPEIALFFAQVTITRRNQAGRLQATDPFIYFTGRFDLKEGEWKMIHGHLSGSMSWVEEG